MLEVRRPQSASSHPIVPDEPNGVSILNERILAGDSFIDGDEHFLFAQQLQQMTELYSLSLNQLPN